jgi:hypothetical protein
MVEMMTTAPHSRWGKTLLSVADVMLILTCALLGACSTTLDVVSIAKNARIAEGLPRFARVEQPAGDPGNVLRAVLLRGALTLEAQQEILKLYRDGLYAALTTLPTDPRLATDCVKCPFLTSRILAIKEEERFPTLRVELTVLFKLTAPEHSGGVFRWTVIRKEGSSSNFSKFVRATRAREEAITKVLRELVILLPSDLSIRQGGTTTPK